MVSPSFLLLLCTQDYGNFGDYSVFGNFDGIFFLIPFLFTIMSLVPLPLPPPCSSFNPPFSLFSSIQGQAAHGRI